MAGTSHVEATPRRRPRRRRRPGRREHDAQAAGAPTRRRRCALPINTGPSHWIVEAASSELEPGWEGQGSSRRWRRGCVRTLVAVHLRGRPHGNTLGGIRSPHVDAPVATLTGGEQRRPASAACSGAPTPFSAAQITALYPTHTKFIAAWRSAANAVEKQGFLLPLDARELKLAAAQSTIGD